jgi:lipoprotein-releasing system permease protein
MDLPFELFVAVRYLLARRKQAFISLISLISVLGVSVGVMALLVALALMTGLQGELRDRLVASTAHVYVWKIGGFANPQEEARRLRELPHVIGAAPVVMGQGLARGVDTDAPISIKGIVPELEPSVTAIQEAMKSGSLDALRNGAESPAGIVLGQDLAQKLGVSLGDTVQVLTPELMMTPVGLWPRLHAFKVVGVFSLGLIEYDASYGFVDLSIAQTLFGKPHPDYMQLRLDDLFRAKDVAASVSATLGADYVAETWAEMNKSLFSALWLEKMGLSIAIGLIVMVAALNIVASLVLLVMEKSRDIAILKTMGSSSANIRRIFVLQGLIIGLVGTASGAGVGLVLIYVLDRFKLIHVPLDVYQISYMPFRLQAQDAVVVLLTAVLICLLATVYPSRQASKLDPAQALRYQ